MIMRRFTTTHAVDRIYLAMSFFDTPDEKYYYQPAVLLVPAETVAYRDPASMSDGAIFLLVYHDDTTQNTLFKLDLCGKTRSIT